MVTLNVCSKIIVHTMDHEENLIFNGYTGSLNVVNSRIASFLHSGFVEGSPLSDSEIEMLKTEYYLLEDETSLADLVYQKVQEFNGRSSVHKDTYVICPTLDCNLFCPYCYEKSSCDRSERINDAILTSILDFITKNSISKERSAEISLFGGEPLLKENTPYNQRIFSFAKAHDLSCTIITNGTTISDESVYELMKEYAGIISHVQVSMDGTKEYHNTMKFTADGSGTFDQVIENISRILSLGISATVRFNISKANVSEIEKVSAFFQESTLCYYDNFNYYFAPIVNSADINDPSLIDEADLAIELERLNLLDKCNLPLLGYFISAIKSTDEPRLPAFQRCDANRSNYYVFSPDEYVYACTELLGMPEYSKGKYHPTYKAHANRMQFEYDNVLKAEGIPKCNACNISLLCGGGCISAKSSCANYCEYQHSIIRKYMNHLRKVFNLR